MAADRVGPPTRGHWPKNPVIYQIYPRSFQDSTGTGEGDLRGITRRLGHVARLGVDGIWLSPFFTSPLCDGGYDVANHVEVDPRYGTLDEFDALVTRAHELGLRVMIDQVFNHTSNQHPWFKKSLAREPGFEDFYVWADPRDDGNPPSNWIGYFGHPAWQWYPQRSQYCLHKFLPCQPGLNHRNPAVHEALGQTMSFWRAHDVDGFRFDAVTSFFHDPEFPDNPPAGESQARIPGPPNNPFTMQKHDHDMLPADCAAFARDIRERAGSNTFLLGEINEGPKSVEVCKAFAGPERLDAGYVVDLTERGLTGTVIADVLERLGNAGGLAWWLTSHDQPRHVSRAGDGSPRDARMMAALLLGLPGPVLIYQGDELGMIQPNLPKDVLQDPFDLAYWPDMPGRDGARTPYVWEEDTPGRGFTDGDPWLPIYTPPDGAAATQWETEDSVLRFYHSALNMRRQLDLAAARTEVLDAKEAFLMATLTVEKGSVILAVNLAKDPVELPAEYHRLDSCLSSAPQPEVGMLAPRSTVWLQTG